MTQPKLHLSDELFLPIDVATRRLAFIGLPGSGKTYAAKKLCELMILAGIQVIPIDVVGVWYGLRLAADGKGSGLNLPIFGGLHGDVPLQPDAGALIADLLVDRNISAVLDISQMEDFEQTKFSTAFARRFFDRKKAKPSPVHLFLEECQELVPQNPMKDETVKLHVFSRISKLGRNFGIGISLISQRPQDINKKVFNLTELMLAFQLNAPAERETVEKWMAGSGVTEKSDLLATLKTGHARVWSPTWLGVHKTVHIAPLTTYDSSSTPKVGARRREPQPLTPIDLEQITQAMRDVVERAKADDPKALRAQLAGLQKDLRAALAAAAKVQPAPAPRVERVEVPVFKDGEVDEMRAAVHDLLKMSADMTDFSKEVAAYARQLGSQIDAAFAKRPAAPAPARPAAHFQEGPGGTIRLSSYQPPASPKPAPAPGAPASEPGEFKITVPQQRILDALAWLESTGRWGIKTLIALLSEQSPTSSSYSNNLGALRSAGLISYPKPNEVQLNSGGRAAAHFPATPPTTDELQLTVLKRLGRSKAIILQVLINAYPDALAKNELAAHAGQSPTSSSYSNNLGALRSLGLIDYPTPGQAVALPVLFLES